MKKRLLSWSLVLCMIMLLLPGTALAAEPRAAAGSWSATTLDGRTINQNTYLGKTQVLVFYRGIIGESGSCYYSNQTIQQIANSPWVSDPNIQVIAIEATGASKGTVESYKATHAPSCDDIVFTYHPVDNFYWSFWRQIGYKGSITYAITAIINPDGTLSSTWMGAYQAEKYGEALKDVVTDSGQPDAGTMQDSGGLSKLSKSEITRLLQENSLTMPSNVFEREPSLTAPYAPGKVTDAALQTAVNRLNALRRIAGLPSVKMDAALNGNAQYGAVLLSVSNFSHYPAQPADMDNSFYTTAKGATSSSNIHYGSGPYANLPRSVDSFMDDSDGSNVSRLGHRRWQLNPVMGKVGFGYVLRDRYGYVAEKVFDSSGAGVNYDFISWPSSGNFPTGNFFHENTAWSVTLNPNKYSAPVKSNITVTVQRQSDGKTWTLRGSQNYAEANSGAYFNVENSNYGVNNCIIFRPDGISSYSGTYVATINGLRTIYGQDTSLSFQVDFFDPSDETPPVTTYTVTYNANGGSGAPSAQIKTHNQPLTLSRTQPTRTGYTFAGWATSSNGRVQYQPGETYTGNANLILYAVWTPVQGNRGDVTGDGEIDMGDVLRLARAVAEYTTLTPQEKALGDVTGDGEITISDVVKLARYVAGYITSL